MVDSNLDLRLISSFGINDQLGHLIWKEGYKSLVVQNIWWLKAVRPTRSEVASNSFEKGAASRLESGSTNRLSWKRSQCLQMTWSCLGLGDTYNPFRTDCPAIPRTFSNNSGNPVIPYYRITRVSEPDWQPSEKEIPTFNTFEVIPRRHRLSNTAIRPPAHLSYIWCLIAILLSNVCWMTK